jgi:hypothetical protein
MRLHVGTDRILQPLETDREEYGQGDGNVVAGLLREAWRGRVKRGRSTTRFVQSTQGVIKPMKIYFVKEEGNNLRFRVYMKGPSLESQDSVIANCKYKEHADMIAAALNKFWKKGGSR